VRPSRLRRRCSGSVGSSRRSAGRCPTSGPGHTMVRSGVPRRRARHGAPGDSISKPHRLLAIERASLVEGTITMFASLTPFLSGSALDEPWVRPDGGTTVTPPGLGESAQPVRGQLRHILQLTAGWLRSHGPHWLGGWARGLRYRLATGHGPLTGITCERTPTNLRREGEGDAHEQPDDNH
jgi:hypothetical protein